ncbi:chalcone isomerase family protein [Vibrio sp. TRT 21S02]|uniref:chalcone isomerase family protein n=1 Tax=Vibrio sp. TRT 21S02 TaxID=3418507 RepID=UPI003CE67098
MQIVKQWKTSFFALLIGTNVVSAEATTIGKSPVWHEWQVVGTAQLTVFIFDVYSSQLLSPNGKYAASNDISPHPLALEIHYQRNISSQQLIDATEEQWRELGYQSSQIMPWVKTVEGIFPNIEQGQSLTYVTDGRVGQFFYANGEVDLYQIGQIEDEQLNDAFLAIWLSPETEYPELRKQLIGENQ